MSDKEIDRVISLSNELGESIETAKTIVADLIELMMEYQNALAEVISEE